LVHPVRSAVIVGGGPVGLTAALMLARQGLSVTVLERSPQPGTDWRASTFHAATLEILEHVDVVDEMHRQGLAVPVFQYRDRRDGLVAEFDYGMIADETKYPHRLQLNQQRLVAILLDRLTAFASVRIQFGATFRELEQHDDRVTVRYATTSGPGSTEADVVIGADGPSSSVRNALGIPFDGMTYPQRFLIASVTEEMDALLPGVANVAYVSDPHEWLFLLRTPESWRVVMPVTSDAPDDELTRPEAVNERLAMVAEAPGGYHLIDTQVYRVHQRVAERFRDGRVMIMGDAAHINSPLGGLGLNSGIHDAIDLGLRLGRLAQGGSADLDGELAAYADRRRSVALEFVQADTHRNTVMMQERDDATRRANQNQLRAVAADPAAAREWLMRASLISAVRTHGIGAPPGSTAPRTSDQRRP
jgi:3-(3-hydroxy-phenyl)propionate hydroxylase